MTLFFSLKQSATSRVMSLTSLRGTDVKYLLVNQFTANFFNRGPGFYCTIAVAHHLEQATARHSGHGVFTDRYIFSLNLPRILRLSDESQFLSDVISSPEEIKNEMAERGEELLIVLVLLVKIPVKSLKVPCPVAVQKKARMKKMNLMHVSSIPRPSADVQKGRRTIGNLDQRGKQQKHNI